MISRQLSRFAAAYAALIELGAQESPFLNGVRSTHRTQSQYTTTLRFAVFVWMCLGVCEGTRPRLVSISLSPFAACCSTFLRMSGTVLSDGGVNPFPVRARPFGSPSICALAAWIARREKVARRKVDAIFYGFTLRAALAIRSIIRQARLASQSVRDVPSVSASATAKSSATIFEVCSVCQSLEFLRAVFADARRHFKVILLVGQLSRPLTRLCSALSGADTSPGPRLFYPTTTAF